MKKIVLFLIFAVVILSALCVGTFTFAEEPEKDSLSPQTIFNNTDYVHLENMKEVAYNDNICAVLETDQAGDYFLKVIGERIEVFPLSSLGLEDYQYSKDDDYYLLTIDNDILLAVSKQDSTILLSYNTTWQILAVFNYKALDIIFDYDADVLLILSEGKIICYNYPREVQTELTENCFWTFGKQVEKILSAGIFNKTDNSLFFKREGRLYRLDYYLTGDREVNNICDYPTDGDLYFARIGENTSVYYLSTDSLKVYEDISFYQREEAAAELTKTDEGSDESIVTFSAVSFAETKVIIADNGYNAVKIFNVNLTLEENKLSLIRMLGSYGTSKNRLKSPSEITSKGNIVFVSDTDNKRIITFDLVDKRERITGCTVTPQRIAVMSDGTIFYCKYDDSSLYDGEGNKYSLSILITGLYAHNNDLYILCGNRIYLFDYQEGQISLYYTADSDISDIVFGGDLLYLRLSDRIITLYQNTSYNLTLDCKQSRFFGDYRGNLYFLEDNTIYRYELYPTGYGEPKEYSIDIDVKDFAITDNYVVLLGDNQLFQLEKSAIDYIDVSTFETVDIVEEPVKVLKIAENCVLYNTPDCYQSFSFLDAGNYVLLRTQITFENKNYYFIEYNRNAYYIPAECSVSALSEGKCDMVGVRSRFGKINLYRYPSYTMPAVVVENLTTEDICNVLSYAAVDGEEDAWGWYKVAYQDKIGYVRILDVVAENNEAKIKHYFVKTESSQLGKYIVLYKDALLKDYAFELSDGVDLEIRTPYDEAKEITQVWYNGDTYFVATKDITKNNITKCQTILIILLIVIIGATILSGFIFALVKREKFNPKR